MVDDDPSEVLELPSVPAEVDEPAVDSPDDDSPGVVVLVAVALSVPGAVVVGEVADAVELEPPVESPLSSSGVASSQATERRSEDANNWPTKRWIFIAAA